MLHGYIECFNILIMSDVNESVESVGEGMKRRTKKDENNIEETVKVAKDKIE